jgi:hypothetical protein
MSNQVTLIELLEYIVVGRKQSVQEAIEFCSPLFTDCVNRMEEFEKGYLDKLEDNGVKGTDSYYLAGYRSCKL